jgi:hypothetical protein
MYVIISYDCYSHDGVRVMGLCSCVGISSPSIGHSFTIQLSNERFDRKLHFSEVHFPEDVVKKCVITSLELRDLDLDGCFIQNFENWKQLESLQVDRCVGLPREFKGLELLEKLERLTLGFNNLQTLPVGIENIFTLTYLCLTGNRLTFIPPELCQLRNLKMLLLDVNELTTLPDNIGDLVELNYLTLSNNPLTSLPKSLEKLNKLSYLGIHGTGIRWIPKGIEMSEEEAKVYYPGFIPRLYLPMCQIDDEDLDEDLDEDDD